MNPRIPFRSPCLLNVGYLVAADTICMIYLPWRLLYIKSPRARRTPEDKLAISCISIIPRIGKMSMTQSDIRNLLLQELSETGIYFCKLEPRIPIQPGTIKTPKNNLLRYLYFSQSVWKIQESHGEKWNCKYFRQQRRKLCQ